MHAGQASKRFQSVTDRPYGLCTHSWPMGCNCQQGLSAVALHDRRKTLCTILILSPYICCQVSPATADCAQWVGPLAEGAQSAVGRGRHHGAALCLLPDQESRHQPHCTGPADSLPTGTVKLANLEPSSGFSSHNSCICASDMQQHYGQASVSAHLPVNLPQPFRYMRLCLMSSALHIAQAHCCIQSYTLLLPLVTSGNLHVSHSSSDKPLWLQNTLTWL